MTRITDGDTIRVEIQGTNERVRLIGIDAPETAKENQAGECFGAEATARLAQLLPLQSRVRLVRDREARDPYDRLLAYVYRASDGLFVNMSLVSQGFAVPLTIRPNVAHADEFAQARSQAEASKVGLWTSCSGDAAAAATAVPGAKASSVKRSPVDDHAPP